MKRTLAFSAVLLGLCVFCRAQTAPGYVVKHRNDIKWNVSGSLPPGVEYHLIYEDPKTDAIQFLARFKSHYSLATHHHAHDETLVVLKGKLGLKTEKGEEILKAGSYVRIPKDLPHSQRAVGLGRCEFLVVMNGPYKVLGLAPEKK